jgi:hypothetical protein
LPWLCLHPLKLLLAPLQVVCGVSPTLVQSYLSVVFPSLNPIHFPRKVVHVRLRQSLDQRFGFFKVSRIKLLGEPNWGLGVRESLISLQFCHFALPGEIPEKSRNFPGVSPGLSIAMSVFSWHEANAIASERRRKGQKYSVSRNVEDSSPLSVHRAFVVHFRVNSDVARGRVAGRVEHVVSG